MRPKCPLCERQDEQEFAEYDTVDGETTMCWECMHCERYYETGDIYREESILDESIKSMLGL